MQQGTDLDYLKNDGAALRLRVLRRARAGAGHELRLLGTAERIGIPQRALSVNIGPETNVESISFTYNALAPTIVNDEIQDRATNLTCRSMTFAQHPPAAARRHAGAAVPAAERAHEPARAGSRGSNVAPGVRPAQGITDRSVDNVVTAQGELDALRYGDLLEPRGLVGLRGAGFTHDGLYYVKSVTHAISRASTGSASP